MSAILALLQSAVSAVKSVFALIPKEGWDHIFAFLTAALIGWMLCFVHYDVSALRAKAADDAIARASLASAQAQTVKGVATAAQTAATTNAKAEMIIAKSRVQSAKLVTEIQNEPRSDVCARSPLMRIYIDGLRRQAGG